MKKLFVILVIFATALVASQNVNGKEVNNESTTLIASAGSVSVGAPYKDGTMWYVKTINNTSDYYTVTYTYTSTASGMRYEQYLELKPNTTYTYCLGSGGENYKFGTPKKV